MNRSTPGLPVHHQLPEFTQTHLYILKLQDNDKEKILNAAEEPEENYRLNKQK